MANPLVSQNGKDAGSRQEGAVSAHEDRRDAAIEWLLAPPRLLLQYSTVQ
jgi:hypothetical protein